MGMSAVPNMTAVKREIKKPPGPLPENLLLPFLQFRIFLMSGVCSKGGADQSSRWVKFISGGSVKAFSPG